MTGNASSNKKWAEPDHEGRVLDERQFPELNAVFYSTDPLEFIKMRIENLALVRGFFEHSHIAVLVVARQRQMAAAAGEATGVASVAGSEGLGEFEHRMQAIDDWRLPQMIWKIR